MDRLYGYNTCTAKNINTYNTLPITHEIIAEYPHSLELLTRITCIQIATCHEHVSICFKDRNTMETFCEEEHFIQTEPMTFIPDYQNRIRISIENIPIELTDAKIRTFLSQYANLVGETHYPGKRYENNYFITGARVYLCTTIKNHLPKHIYKFGRHLNIRYDNQTTQNIQQQNEEIQPQNEEMQHETEPEEEVPRSTV